MSFFERLGWHFGYLFHRLVEPFVAEYEDWEESAVEERIVSIAVSDDDITVDWIATDTLAEIREVWKRNDED